ncbi:hypothetical protein RFI_15713, partial [Reticulomyxa filosa]
KAALCEPARNSKNLQATEQIEFELESRKAIEALEHVVEEQKEKIEELQMWKESVGMPALEKASRLEVLLRMAQEETAAMERELADSLHQVERYLYVYNRREKKKGGGKRTSLGRIRHLIKKKIWEEIAMANENVTGVNDMFDENVRLIDEMVLLRKQSVADESELAKEIQRNKQLEFEVTQLHQINDKHKEQFSKLQERLQLLANANKETKEENQHLKQQYEDMLRKQAELIAKFEMNQHDNNVPQSIESVIAKDTHLDLNTAIG